MSTALTNEARPVRVEPRMPLTPSMARRMLRFELERLVAERGVQHHTIARWLGVSRPAVTASLLGKTLFSRPALEVICNRLELNEWLPRLDGILGTARREPGASKPEADNAELLIGLEAFADGVTVFDPWLVPTLLQTQMYAAALTTLDNTVQNLAREQRQAALPNDHDPLVLRWITSEHALHRRVGGKAVMDDQRAFLAEMSGRANVTILVVPARTELPPISPFQLVHGTPPVVVESSRLAVHYAHDDRTVAHFVRLAADLTTRALGCEDSLELIREIGG